MWPFSRRKKLNGATEDDLGSILMHFGVSIEDLESALAEQAKNGKKLGQILVDRAVISARILQEALLKQKLIRGHASTREVSSFRRMARSRLMEETTQALKDVHALVDDPAG